MAEVAERRRRQPPDALQRVRHAATSSPRRTCMREADRFLDAVEAAVRAHLDDPAPRSAPPSRSSCPRAARTRWSARCSRRRHRRPAALRHHPGRAGRPVGDRPPDRDDRGRLAAGAAAESPPARRDRRPPRDQPRDRPRRLPRGHCRPHRRAARPLHRRGTWAANSGERAGRGGRISGAAPLRSWARSKFPSRASLPDTINGMRTTIDNAGRIVIPKDLRTTLDLNGGDEVEITLEDETDRAGPGADAEVRLPRGGMVFLLPILAPAASRAGGGSRRTGTDAPMIAPDTSVLVAGFVPDHEFHEAAASALAEVRADGCLIAHTTAETFSVLSGSRGDLPRPAQCGCGLTWSSSRALRPIPASPGGRIGRPFQPPSPTRGRAGGAIYDALIALAARGRVG